MDKLIMLDIEKVQTKDEAQKFVELLTGRAGRTGLEREQVEQIVKATILDLISRMPMDASRFELEELFAEVFSAPRLVQLTRSGRINI